MYLNLRNNLQISITAMDDVTFENPMFDPDGPVDDDFDLPDPPMEPPFDVQQQLNGDNLQSLQEKLREAELEAQKKRLVDSFYNEVSHTYNGLRPENRIDYSQFEIDPEGKTLYWMPEDKKISITATRGKIPVSGSRDTGPKIRGWWHLCTRGSHRPEENWSEFGRP